jgi:membrane protein implicated in regulation of membrane protease activity
VGGLLDQPVLVYLSIALATALVLIELALPTFGLAGFTALGLSVFAVAGINEQQIEWWPMIFVAVALGLWSVMIASRTRSIRDQALAAGFFAGGSLGFAAAASDPATWAVAAVACVGLPVGFPRLYTSTVELMERPSDVGMDGFVGRVAPVTRWADTAGAIEIDGSFWNATGPEGLTPGELVEVTGFHRMTFTVERAVTGSTDPRPQES